MVEEWRTVKGFPRYEVSNLGRVRNSSGREMTPSTSVRGYLVVGLRRNGKSYTKTIHRILAETYLPNPDNYPVVRHLNDVRKDNRLKNLAWGTHRDNSLDSIRNGRNHEKNKTHCLRGHVFSQDAGRKRVCGECMRRHRKEYQKREYIKGVPPGNHGKRSTYVTYSCRCQPCTKANQEYGKLLKDKKREKD